VTRRLDTLEHLPTLRARNAGEDLGPHQLRFLHVETSIGCYAAAFLISIFFSFFCACALFGSLTVGCRS
jgi:hypothetical protein